MPVYLSFLFSAVPLLIWVYVVALRGQFWRVKRHFPTQPDLSQTDVRIVAVIPARNEAAVIDRAITSLLAQDLIPPIQIIVVDDASTDGTSEVAQIAAERAGRAKQLTIISGLPLTPGWTGKLWAMSQGVARAETLRPDFLLFTDADVQHGRTAIAELVTTAKSGNFQMASFMVKLACQNPAERLLIPAFVYFFFQLYPPSWIQSGRRRTAGAAGGCILLQRETLQRAGGLGAIRNQIIDDCALARIVKSSGARVWLGLARESSSLRGYSSMAEIRGMISRTAFNQLRHSAFLLVATIFGLLIVYVSPLCLAFSRHGLKAAIGWVAWALMSFSFYPLVKFYGQQPLWCLSLPLAAIIYADATIRSAMNYWRGRGGQWKGRAQDSVRSNGS